ncbi:MAG: hypothetical protein IJC53_07060, partial [Clostridia bacterium]|nr:hypothetical protein [Clostridia bacterium]
AHNYWLISTYQKAQGKAEETLSSLENMCYHAVEYDKSYANDHGKTFTSVLTDKLIYPASGKDFHELTEHSQCWYMLDRMENKRYNLIRQDPRFISVIERLKRSAR